MNLSNIPNQNVRTAIEALQKHDKATWFNCFAEDAIFTDDGVQRDFKPFFDNAFEKKEKFLDIDTIEDEGKHICGNFDAGQWGTFRVYFKFTTNARGKFDRLDIGQTSKLA